MVFKYFKGVERISKRSASRFIFGLTSVAMLMGQSACTDNPSVVKYEAPKSAVVEVAATGGALTEQSGPLIWEASEGWLPGKASSMRLASFAVPVEGGESGDVSLVKLAGAAGGELANVNRWAGQIGMPPYNAESVKEVIMDRTTSRGVAYNLVTLINEDANRAILVGYYMMGGDAVFAKMTVSQSGLETAVPGFLEFCDSIGTSSN